MKVMVFAKATQDTEDKVPPNPKMINAMHEYNEALIAAGILKDPILGGLKPTRFAKRVRFSGQNRTVIDGPFTETKEVVAGFSLWEVKSIEEAVEWVKKCPIPRNGLRSRHSSAVFAGNMGPRHRVTPQPPNICISSATASCGDFAPATCRRPGVAVSRPGAGVGPGRSPSSSTIICDRRAGSSAAAGSSPASSARTPCSSALSDCCRYRASTRHEVSTWRSASSWRVPSTLNASRTCS